MTFYTLCTINVALSRILLLNKCRYLISFNKRVSLYVTILTLSFVYITNFVVSVAIMNWNFNTSKLQPYLQNWKSTITGPHWIYSKITALENRSLIVLCFQQLQVNLRSTHCCHPVLPGPNTEYHIWSSKTNLHYLHCSGCSDVGVRAVIEPGRSRMALQSFPFGPSWHLFKKIISNVNTLQLIQFLT
jgi:hypothetical protein